MNKELEILKAISEQEKITQRELSERTGLSLGAINILVKKLMQKGLIKIEGLKPKTIRYLLTPKGFAEKTQRTYEYLNNYCKQILNIQNKLIRKLNQNEAIVKEVILVGEQSHLYKIIIMTLEENKVPYRSIENYPVNDKCEDQTIIVWNASVSSHLSERGIKHINILDVVS